MPKAPKALPKQKHDPLHVQLGEDEVYAKYGRISQPGRRRKSRAKDDDNDETGEVGFPSLPLPDPLLIYSVQAILDPKTSRRIFELARDQQEEFDEKDLDDEDEDESRPSLAVPRELPEDDDDFDLDRYEDNEEEIEEIVSKPARLLTLSDDKLARKLMKMT